MDYYLAGTKVGLLVVSVQLLVETMVRHLELQKALVMVVMMVYLMDENLVYL